jgi:hypothetical protein
MVVCSRCIDASMYGSSPGTTRQQVRLSIFHRGAWRRASHSLTELLHGLHADFTWVTHTASRQRGPALAEARKKKPLRGSASMPTAVAFDTQACGSAAQLQRCNGAAQCVHAKYRLLP